ncbi:adenylate/guanylate cyclase domain-containing protein [Roseibium sp. RKSG952]|uniref:adenylate/guanylate cyclase domain-containing protein n=1 Tax=Roseibium sp. RKSG952 TaxID=2529384 RepID=UPI0012BB5BBA|nr:adenylate/guanylate cyclase domain-containing protein [Roseibium sp. RKSG952]MTH96333.1 adenylate/guanylate cyclase domain-containing protein [Roseibium sp. RKSG952]
MVLEAPLVAADVVQWLYSDAVELKDSLELIEQLAGRLRAGGVPVDRATTAIVLLHPNVRAEASVWTSDGLRELRRYPANQESEEVYLNSPVRIVYTEGRSVRCRIAPDRVPDEFGIINDLRQEGYTDYIALPLPFSDGTYKALTFATKAPGGFTPGHISIFESVNRPLALICELRTLRRTAETLLDTYVGARAGGRVLNGSIQRGDGEWISAIVSFADLRGFTRLSNDLPADKLILLLNKYFGAMTEAVEAHGGEVLKFIGDEVMAIFPYESEGGARDAARRALSAARETTRRIEAINRNNTCSYTPSMRVGISLHAGDVFFGNVGGENRLDFTVIGPVVNLAARIAELAKDLDKEVLVSDAIADIMGCRQGIFGSYRVKGFDDPVSVYSPHLVTEGPEGWCPEARAFVEASTVSRALEAN